MRFLCHTVINKFSNCIAQYAPNRGIDICTAALIYSMYRRMQCEGTARMRCKRARGEQNKNKWPSIYVNLKWCCFGQWLRVSIMDIWPILMRCRFVHYGAPLAAIVIQPLNEACDIAFLSLPSLCVCLGKSC